MGPPDEPGHEVHAPAWQVIPEGHCVSEAHPVHCPEEQTWPVRQPPVASQAPQKPWRQASAELQSDAVPHAWPAAQPAQVPPQSRPVSVPFFTLSSQRGASVCALIASESAGVVAESLWTKSEPVSTRSAASA